VRVSDGGRRSFCAALTNPDRAPNALSLHNEHNSVNHPHSPTNWSVTYMAVQPRLGLLSQRRTRFDSFDSDNSGVSRCTLRFASYGIIRRQGGKIGSEARFT